MKILVLGSGIIGVTTAYYLHKSGHEVTVIDRNSNSAAECSYANGGQLSYSHAEPWANPITLNSIPRWLIAKNSPLSVGNIIDYRMWKWIWKFIGNCNSKQAKDSTKKLLEMALLSRNEMREICDDINIEFNQSQCGTLHLFEHEKLLEEAINQAKFQQEFGCEFEVLNTRESCLEKEPALVGSNRKFIGGIFFPLDASGDIHQFTNKLASYLAKKGVDFLYDTEIKSLKVNKYENKIEKVVTHNKVISADKYIVTLGAYSSLLLRNIGITLPIYPVKGYSLTIPINKDDLAPNICITDIHHKIVTSRLGSELRIAGMADFSGYDHRIYPARIRALKTIANDLFPNMVNIDKAKEWSCLRPSTPDGIPIISKSRYNNLYINTGHGSLGWTLAAGSAFALNKLIL